jgi:hypothetical protein
MFDLGEKRRERAEARAAQQEGKQTTLEIGLDGVVFAELPAEWPLDVLSPLRQIDETIALLIRQALSLVQSNDRDNQMAATQLVVDLIASNPNLPTTVLDVIHEIGRNLLGDDGYGKLLAARPSKEDAAALAKAIFEFYGVGLGESLPSNDSSTSDGGTLKQISSDTSTSTPEDSGDTQQTEAS